MAMGPQFSGKEPEASPSTTADTRSAMHDMAHSAISRETANADAQFRSIVERDRELLDRLAR